MPRRGVDSLPATNNGPLPPDPPRPKKRLGLVAGASRRAGTQRWLI